MLEENSEIKIPTTWTDGNADVGRVREEKSRREKMNEEKVRRKKMQVRLKVEKSRFTVFFPIFRCPRGATTRLAKAAGAEPFGQMRDEKLQAIAARSTRRSQT